MKNLYGKRLNKVQAEKLEELFDLIAYMHKEVDEKGYWEFVEEQGLTDNYDDILDAVDDLFVSFGGAEKRMEDK